MNRFNIDELREHRADEVMVGATPCYGNGASSKHSPPRSECEADMWRLVLASVILGASSFGYAGQAFAQSAPGAVVVRDSTGDGELPALIPATPAEWRVISVREGPALSVVVLPAEVAGSDPSLAPIGEPGRVVEPRRSDPAWTLPTYNNPFGDNGPFS